MIWFWMMLKRLFRKPVFWVILLLIPFFSLIMRWMSSLDRGWVAIAVSGEGDGRAYAESIMQDFESSARTVRVIFCDDPDEAEALVARTDADAAWIFLDGIEERIHTAATDANASVPLVRVVERVDNVFLKLAREKLFMSLYGDLSYEIYADFVVEKMGEFAGTGSVTENGDVNEGSSVTEAELAAYHELNASDGEIVVLSMIGEKTGQTAAMPDADYLLAPTRGMLSCLVMLAGLISAILYLRDERAGVHTWLSPKKKILIQTTYYLSAMLPVLILVLPALYFSGLWTGVGHELMCALLLLADGLLFVDVARLVVRDERRLSVLLPILFLGLVFFCPIFLNMKKLRILHLLFPPFYYLHGIFNGRYLLRGLIYLAVMLAVDLLLRVGEHLLLGPRKKPLGR